MVQNHKTDLFENMPVSKALAIMAVPTIISQLITLIYNMSDTWFVGRTGNPYMVAASSLVLTVYLMAGALANLFGVGGGTLVVRLLGSKNEDDAKQTAGWTLAAAAVVGLCFSAVCLLFMNPLLRLLGASDRTIHFARQYLFFVIVLGGFFNITSSTMSFLLRNVGFSREAAFGLGMGGLLNIALDPLFMFVLLPDGMQVIGAGIATMLSNVASFLYFIIVYKKVRGRCVLEIPKGFPKISRELLRDLLSVGIPASFSVFLFDLTNIVINRLSSSHGDIELAAIGIVLKAERLPLNVGIGICLGMVPLVAYNYASGNFKRMRSIFTASRIAGLAVSVLSIILYRSFASQIIGAFIPEERTVLLGTAFLKARCFAAPFMFLSFNMVHFMQAVDRGGVSFRLCVIRQIFLNIPFLFVLNRLFGMSGIVWTQVTADIFNVVVSYIIYDKIIRQIVNFRDSL